MQASGQVDICGEILEADEYEIGFNTQEGIEAEATREVVVLLETEISPELEIKGLHVKLFELFKKKEKVQVLKLKIELKLIMQQNQKF